MRGLGPVNSVIDRTAQFRQTARGNGAGLEPRKGRPLASPFIATAIDLGHRIEELHRTLVGFSGEAYSLEPLLAPLHTGLEEAHREHLDETKDVIMRGIAELMTQVREFEAQIAAVAAQEEGKEETDGTAAFCAPIATTLYARIFHTSQVFKKVELSRLKDEERLQSIFAPPVPVVAFPQIERSRTDLPFSEEAECYGLYPPLRVFLPPQFRRMPPATDKKHPQKPILASPNPPSLRSAPSAEGLSFGQATAGQGQEGLQEPEQQRFAEEHAQLLLQRTEETMDEQHVRAVDKHLAELNLIDTFFAEQVMMQHETIQSVVDSLEGSMGTVDEANKQLRKAVEKKRGATYRTYMVVLYLAYSVVLLFLDAVTSRRTRLFRS